MFFFFFFVLNWGRKRIQAEAEGEIRKEELSEDF